MLLHHFYHAWCAGEWRQPVGEHLYALQASGWNSPITVGLVGPKDERREVRRWFQFVFPWTEFVEASKGWEQVTLAAILKSLECRSDGAVLYAHTKGAANPHGLQDRWRQSMTSRVVSDWRQCLAALDKGYDAVGCHWLTPDTEPRSFHRHFSGNFWMATRDYLSRLEPCPTNTRHEAEFWIGTGDPLPRTLDLLPGWPSVDLCVPPLSVGRLEIPKPPMAA